MPRSTADRISAIVSCLCVPDRNVLPPPSAQVLFVADQFHPVNDLAVELFLNGNVSHGCGWRGTMPMFLEPARTRSRPLGECPRLVPPSVGPGHSQPSRSASGPAGEYAMLPECRVHT